MTLREDLEGLKPAEPKILTIDIETSPNLVYAWGLWDQNISVSQLIEPSRVLCFAAKWLHDRKVIFHDEREGRKQMLTAAWDLLNEADIVVGYNHEKFDIPHLNREFLTAGLLPPSPAQYVDLLKINRRNFNFASNKLGFVTEQLRLDTKLETGGQDLWNAVLQGDEKAWRKFRRYNIQDVLITEQLFHVLSPWIKGPHKGMWVDSMKCCYSCGSENLSLTGFLYEKVMVYPKYQCNGCGAWNKVLRNGQTRAA